MSKNAHLPSPALATILSALLLLVAGCGSGKSSQTGTDAGADTATGTDAHIDTGTTPDDGGTTDTGTPPVAITLNESAYAFPTPDAGHGPERRQGHGRPHHLPQPGRAGRGGPDAVPARLPYNTGAATGKRIMLANVVISGVTN